MKKFELGEVVMTRGIANYLESELFDTQQLSECVKRHESGDWGDLCDEDKRMNDYAIKYGDRILSAYTVGEDIKIWIITECDRSYTTILLPEEY